MFIFLVVQGVSLNNTHFHVCLPKAIRGILYQTCINIFGHMGVFRRVGAKGAAAPSPDFWGQMTPQTFKKERHTQIWSVGRGCYTSLYPPEIFYFILETLLKYFCYCFLWSLCLLCNETNKWNLYIFQSQLCTVVKGGEHPKKGLEYFSDMILLFGENIKIWFFFPKKVLHIFLCEPNFSKKSLVFLHFPFSFPFTRFLSLFSLSYFPVYPFSPPFPFFA